MIIYIFAFVMECQLAYMFFDELKKFRDAINEARIIDKHYSEK